MADHFQTFPIVGQDLTGKQGKQVLQDSLDALYDLIQRMQSRSALDLRGALTLRSGRGDSPMDGDGGAGLFVQALDDYLGGRRGFDLRVLAGLPRDTNERVAEDRVTTITVRVVERAGCDGKIELLNCNKTVRASVGTDGTLRAADVDGATFTAGLPGFLTDGDAPYHLKADGTKVALGGGGGSLATLTDVDLTGLGDGDTIVYDLATTTWYAVPAGSGGGAVSEVVAGVGLVGGGTGGSVTVALDYPVDVALGGTGGTTAADARTGIGAASQADLDALALDDLVDVDAPAPADGDVLTWVDADSEWQAVAPSGGGSSGRTLLGFPQDGPVAWGEFGYYTTSGLSWTQSANILQDGAGSGRYQPTIFTSGLNTGSTGLKATITLEYGGPLPGAVGPNGLTFRNQCQLLDGSYEVRVTVWDPVTGTWSGSMTGARTVSDAGPDFGDGNTSSTTWVDTTIAQATLSGLAAGDRLKLKIEVTVLSVGSATGRNCGVSLLQLDCTG